MKTSLENEKIYPLPVSTIQPVISLDDSEILPWVKNFNFSKHAGNHCFIFHTINSFITYFTIFFNFCYYVSLFDCMNHLHCDAFNESFLLSLKVVQLLKRSCVLKRLLAILSNLLILSFGFICWDFLQALPSPIIHLTSLCSHIYECLTHLPFSRKF